MSRKLDRALRLYSHKISRGLWQTKAVWLRALLCWGIGIGFLFLDETNHFDERFRLRGAQPLRKDIVLVLVSQAEWVGLNGDNRNLLRAMKEFTTLTDNFFWNPELLSDVLKVILDEKPKAVGVSFFFPPSLSPRPEAPIFFDKRVLWAARLNTEGQPLLPATASNYGYNAGVIDTPPDDDRIWRKFSQPISEIPHFATRLAQISHDRLAASETMVLPGESELINFRGRSGRFPIYSLTEVLSDNIDFKDKIVILGSADSETHFLSTPLGEMTRGELLANVLDNILEQRWVDRLPFIFGCLFLLGILIFCIWILFSYPQSVAFVFIFWLGIGLTAISLWVFDSLYFWIPTLAPLATMSVTYVIFTGYQLTLKENQTWRLEQEKKYLFEVEQLKNNFVSLISHDLKTPIAKIQAICDRLRVGEQNTEIVEGLKSLRHESTELHRYIQSILRVSRIESRDFRVNREAADINEIIEKVLQQLKPLAEQKGVHLTADLEPMFSIEIDSVLIQEVILNLIENAIKYTPQGGKVKVSSKEVDEEVHFKVEDTGEGIAKADQERIFHKFYRGEDQKLSTKGTGMGLYLVKYFVEVHGGRVFLSSEEGKGTAIGFILPLHHDEKLEKTGVPT